MLPQADTHAKVIDSRSGSLFCHMCDDFVWDPTLEDLRNRKIDTGTFSSKTKFVLSLFTRHQRTCWAPELPHRTSLPPRAS